MTAGTSPSTMFSQKDLVGVVAIPAVAVPTVALTAVSVGTWLVLFASLLLAQPILPLSQTVLVITVCIFLAFTPMHDATHGSIATSASGLKGLNTVVGVSCSLAFCAPFHAFKHMHLQHHKHTNDHDKDPDFWSGSGNPWLLPLRWLTQEFRYYILYLPILHTRQRSEIVVVVIQLIAVWGFLAYAISAGLWSACLYGWIIPGRLASMALACTFDYLPHRPHAATREENPFKATAVTSLFAEYTRVLTWPLLHQNYHNIHHMYPYIPFYQYQTVWKAMKPKLIAAGTDIIPIFGRSRSKRN